MDNQEQQIPTNSSQNNIDSENPAVEQNQDLVGIKFQKTGKVYYFLSQGLNFQKDDLCVVETERSQTIGTVSIPKILLSEVTHRKPLRKVLRKATEEDFTLIKENEEKSAKAFEYCQYLINNHEIPMKIVRVEHSFDGSKATFYFSAEGRIDFRELHKDLAHELKVRVEMKQIGVRDEARMLGGIGCCGRKLCCASFLNEFEPVSIRMAKEQNLTLNPAKISGTCGRLMCCLMYEYKHYEQVRKRLPKMGKKVESSQGLAKVKQINVLRNSVTLELKGGQIIEVNENRLQRKGNNWRLISEEELQAEAPSAIKEKSADKDFHTPSQPETNIEQS